jgi:hypothetical protein
MSTLVTILVFLLLAISTLGVREAVAKFGYRWAEHFVRVAAKRVREDRRADRLEEWLDQVNLLLSRNLPLSALCFAGGAVLSAVRMRKDGAPSRRGRLAEWVASRFRDIRTTTLMLWARGWAGKAAVIVGAAGSAGVGSAPLLIGGVGGSVMWVPVIAGAVCCIGSLLLGALAAFRYAGK